MVSLLADSWSGGCLKSRALWDSDIMVLRIGVKEYGYCEVCNDAGKKKEISRLPSAYIPY